MKKPRDGYTGKYTSPLHRWWATRNRTWQVEAELNQYQLDKILHAQANDEDPDDALLPWVATEAAMNGEGQ